VLTAAALLVACQDTDVADPATPDRAGAIQPFASAGAGELSLTGFMGGNDVYGGPCTGVTGGIELRTTGIGTLSHFGAVEMYEYTCINLATFDFVSWYTMTAANGDFIWGDVTSVGYTDAGAPVLYCSITGGTGRFTNASGTLVGEAGPVEPGSPYDWEGPMWGTITYNAPVPGMAPYRADIPFAPASPAMTACSTPPGYDGPPVALPALQAGWGHHSHLGLAYSEITIDACQLTPDGLIGGGHFTHTAKNGDGISGRWDALFTPPTWRFVENGKPYPAMIDAGTGRFAGATGYGFGGGTIDLATGKGTAEVNGWLSSVGASK
jgi:hypothetical protein